MNPANLSSRTPSTNLGSTSFVMVEADPEQAPDAPAGQWVVDSALQAAFARRLQQAGGGLREPNFTPQHRPCRPDVLPIFDGAEHLDRVRPELEAFLETSERALDDGSASPALARSQVRFVHRVLRLDQGASADVCHQAVRHLLRTHHTDRNPNAEPATVQLQVRALQHCRNLLRSSLGETLGAQAGPDGAPLWLFVDRWAVFDPTLRALAPVQRHAAVRPAQRAATQVAQGAPFETARAALGAVGTSTLTAVALAAQYRLHAPLFGSNGLIGAGALGCTAAVCCGLYCWRRDSRAACIYRLTDAEISLIGRCAEIETAAHGLGSRACAQQLDAWVRELDGRRTTATGAFFDDLTALHMDLLDRLHRAVEREFLAAQGEMCPPPMRSDAAQEQLAALFVPSAHFRALNRQIIHAHADLISRNLVAAWR
jgi:hypothetical protein